MPSSVIRHFKYDQDLWKLTIPFTSGATYEYRGVPAAIVERFRAAFSKGMFFTRYIRNRYNYTKIG